MSSSITYLIDDDVLVIDEDRRFTIGFLRQMDYEIVSKRDAEIARLREVLAEVASGEYDATWCHLRARAALGEEPR